MPYKDLQVRKTYQAHYGRKYYLVHKEKLKQRRSERFKIWYANPENREIARLLYQSWYESNKDICSCGKLHQGRSKKCFSCSRPKGVKHSNWKGGITPKNIAIRKSSEYKEWRKKVFERDKYTCQLCGIKGGDLEVDHIKTFFEFPELRFSLGNGRTLCISCHKKTPTYGRRKIRVEEMMK